MHYIFRAITGVVNFHNWRSVRSQQTNMLLSITIMFTVFSIGSCFEPGKFFFDTSDANVTVLSNTTAVLPCSVENRGSHQWELLSDVATWPDNKPNIFPGIFKRLLEDAQKKVAWMNPTRILISSGVRRVIDDTRMSIERPYVKDWNLHIRYIRYSDVGSYTCSVDTDPVLVKIFYLDVQVPPNINDWSTRGMVASEGDEVQLICNATGHPMPVITWIKRLNDGDEEKIGNFGEVLLIHNISRYCDGIYECRADNGIVPHAIRQMQVEVEFPPEVDLLNRRQGQVRGRETMLDCNVIASPHGYSLWKKNGVQIPTDPWKYRIHIYEKMDPHMITLSLTILNVAHSDFGDYTCQASNKLGSDSEAMTLYESVVPTTRRTTTTTELSRRIDKTRHTPMRTFIAQDTITPAYRPIYDNNKLGEQGFDQVQIGQHNGAVQNCQHSGLICMLILYIGGVTGAFIC